MLEKTCRHQNDIVKAFQTVDESDQTNLLVAQFVDGDLTLNRKQQGRREEHTYLGHRPVRAALFRL